MKRVMILGALITSAGWAQRVPKAPLVWKVSGILQGDDGSVIRGASVSLTALPPYQTKSRLRHWSGVTGVDGNFDFQGLYPGQFQACAQAPGTTWLDSCQWGLKPLIVTLSLQDVAVVATMVLSKGAFLPVRVSDGGGYLDLNEGITTGANLLIGLSNDGGAWVPAQLASKDAGGRTYQVLVPINRSVQSIVSSSLFALTDGAGAALRKVGPTATIPVTVASGKAIPTVALSVVGLAKVVVQ